MEHLKKPAVLVIDDQLGISDSLRSDFLRNVDPEGEFEFSFVTSQVDGKNESAAACAEVERLWGNSDAEWALVLLDVQFDQREPGAEDARFGLKLLEVLRSEFGRDLPVAMLTQEGKVKQEANRLGADGFLGKRELSGETFLSIVNHAGLLRDATGHTMGASRALLLCLRELRRLLETGTGEILLLGETGSGKTHLARYIHAHSRRSGPLEIWYANPANADLHYSQLFGHWAGAFFGAEANVPGAAERAHLGTLLVDEIGDLHPDTQAQLLEYRYRDERGRRKIRRLGNSAQGRRAKGGPNLIGDFEEKLDRILVDTLCLFATNRPIDDGAERKRIGFREDLFHALGPAVHVPALRERKRDVVPLIHGMFRALGRSLELAPGVVDVLLQYSWPGNLTELRGVAIQILRELGPGFDTVEVRHLPVPLLRPLPSKEPPALPSVGAPTVSPRLDGNRNVDCDLVQVEVRFLADRVRLLGNAIEITEKTLSVAVGHQLSPVRIVRVLTGAKYTATEAKRLLKDILVPIFKPGKRDANRWASDALYARLKNETEANSAIQRLWEVVRRD